MGIFVVIIAAALSVMRDDAALGMTFLALLAATFLFGILTETRVYLDFLPLLVLAARPKETCDTRTLRTTDSLAERA